MKHYQQLTREQRYQIYGLRKAGFKQREIANEVVWGNGNSGTTTVADGYLLGLFTVVRDYPVYGSIPTGQNTAAGVYTDTIIVTVNY